MNKVFQLPPNALPEEDDSSLAYQVAFLESSLAYELMYELFRMGYPHDVNEKHSDTTLLMRWVRRQGARHAPAYRVSDDFPVPEPGQPWPKRENDQPVGISHPERVACLLVLAGANPFDKDANGMDVLDVAVLAGWRNLFKTIMLHPDAPDAQALSARTLSHRNQDLPWMPAVVAFNLFDWLPVFGSYGMDIAGYEEKWPAASFVKSEVEFNGKLKDFSLWPSTHAQVAKVLQHWQRRAKQNDLTPPAHAALIESMSRVRLEEGSVSLPQMKFADAIEKTLLATKKKNQVRFSFKEPLAEDPALRHTLKQGANRGTWSCLAAYCLAALRLNEEGGVLPLLRDTSELALQHQAALSETIRPGLTGAGLAQVVYACSLSKSTRITAKFPEGGYKDVEAIHQELASSEWSKSLLRSGIDLSQPAVQEEQARAVLETARALTTTNSPLSTRATLGSALGAVHEFLFQPLVRAGMVLPPVALELYRAAASIGWWESAVMPLSMWRTAQASWQTDPTPQATEKLLEVGRAWLEDVSNGWWDKYRYNTSDLNRVAASRLAHNNLQEEVLTWMLALPPQQQPKDLVLPGEDEMKRLTKASPSLAALWRSVVLDVRLDTATPSRAMRF